MTENEIAARVLDAAFKVHRTLGPGLLESVYHTVLVYVLRKNGLAVRAPAPIDIVYDDLRFTGAFAADLIVEDKVVVELKSVEKTAPVHKKQCLTNVPSRRQAARPAPQLRRSHAQRRHHACRERPRRHAAPRCGVAA